MKPEENNIIVFAGQEVGEKTLAYLLENNAPVSCVVASSEKDEGILKLAKDRGIRAASFSLRLKDELIREGRRYGWLLNLWSHHILSLPLLGLARRRLNLHTGFVPLVRGTCGASWMIRKGLPIGVALLEMEKEVDSGAVWVQKPLAVDFPIQGFELQKILKAECVNIFKANWPSISSGAILPKPQDGPAQSFRLKETERDRALSSDTVLSLDAFVRWILAHNFHPDTTAVVRYPDTSYRIRVILEKDE